ncbi:MAG TPA: hypothetical protein VMW27_30665 [Thermoanaerobaculia bacterium]|nr:hypothetical protein [Thermoanaerobaculia bacterium]
MQVLLLIVLLSLPFLAAGRALHRRIVGIWRRLAVAAGLAILWLAGVLFILLASITFLGRCASTCW